MVEQTHVQTTLERILVGRDKQIPAISDTKLSLEDYAIQRRHLVPARSMISAVLVLHVPNPRRNCSIGVILGSPPKPVEGHIYADGKCDSSDEALSSLWTSITSLVAFCCPCPTDPRIAMCNILVP